MNSPVLTIFYLGGALCAPRVIKIDRLVTKSISNVMKLIENSSNTLPKLLVPFLAIFFGSGACWGGAAGQKGPRYGNLPIWENVIKSLNMMGNDSQRTGYVVSNHLLTPGIF